MPSNLIQRNFLVRAHWGGDIAKQLVAQEEWQIWQEIFDCRARGSVLQFEISARHPSSRRRAEGFWRRPTWRCNVRNADRSYPIVWGTSQTVSGDMVRALKEPVTFPVKAGSVGRIAFAQINLPPFPVVCRVGRRLNWVPWAIDTLDRGFAARVHRKANHSREHRS